MQVELARTWTDSLAIRHNESGQTFEAEIADGVAHADYHLKGDTMLIVHVEVPRAVRGHGVAGQVVQAALDHARARNLNVVPLCSYARSYMRRHPDSFKLLPSTH
jgi:predicted GNAT family acetyltransferase